MTALSSPMLCARTYPVRRREGRIALQPAYYRPAVLGHKQRQAGRCQNLFFFFFFLENALHDNYLFFTNT